VVKKAFFGRALILTKMDRDDLPKLVNSDIIGPYFMFSQRFLGNEVISTNAKIGVCFLTSEFWKFK
jgi:hypothetical protein